MGFSLFVSLAGCPTEGLAMGALELGAGGGGPRLKKLKCCWPNINPWLPKTLVNAHVKLVMDGLVKDGSGQILENIVYYSSNNNQMDFLGRHRRKGIDIIELRPLEQWVSEMCPQTNSISVTWTHVSNANSQASPQTY